MTTSICPSPLCCFLSGHNMVKDITVVDTNYTDYAVVLKHKVYNREYTQVALYGEIHWHVYFYITRKHVSCRASTVLHCSVCVCVSLYVFAGRSLSVKNNVIQKFKALALSQGFPRESILTPPPAGKGGGSRIYIYTYSIYTCTHTHTRWGELNNPEVS